MDGWMDGWADGHTDGSGPTDRQSGDKCQSKTLFLMFLSTFVDSFTVFVFYLLSSIVLTFSIAAYPLWNHFCSLKY